MPPRGRAHHDETDNVEEPKVSESPAEDAVPDATPETPEPVASEPERTSEPTIIVATEITPPATLSDEDRVRVPNVYVAQLRPGQ